MTRSPRVIWDNTAFFTQLPELQAGDIVATRLRLKIHEEHLLLDLVERGIILIPSATSQLASRSKTFQTRVFHRHMLPATIAIYNSQNLLENISLYHQLEIKKVVVKHDRKNAGQGVYLFNSIEEVYSLTANSSLPFPFVLQPFIKSNFDLRVIMLGDYVEAYHRKNPHNFRNNLHCGGQAVPQELSKEQYNFCQEILLRGSFPYAHLDLMLTDENDMYLTEINLRGGLKGAKISTEEYKEKQNQHNQKLVKQLLTQQ